MNSLKRFLLIGLALCLASPVFAGKPTNRSTEPGAKSAQVEMIERYALAASMADYGESTKNPVVLLAAAQVMKDAGLGPEADEDSARILESAMRSAGTNLKLRSLITAEMRRQGVRGNVRGPAKRVNRLEPSGMAEHDVRFLAGERAAVYVKSRESSRFKVSVYDENGNLVTARDGMDRECMVQWTPDWDGLFTIEVDNKEQGAELAYLMLTN
ncbi:hypothetical protein [uncultured Pseudodesulfovibrio sp.]|uniref:hypothetical protein n=1 Tax=uncultured Pseudodesulfovibrio sp. TaxID=2035858 RepID=UPI0029C99F1F|nr:hypothetical protein [uncultured Pseudodesulfovibrio sp.]